jgi:hypothetical protein
MHFSETEPGRHGVSSLLWSIVLNVRRYFFSFVICGMSIPATYLLSNISWHDITRTNVISNFDITRANCLPLFDTTGIWVNLTTYNSSYWMQVVPDAGHSANEIGIAAELRSATESLRDMLRK